ncbi:Nucleoporin NUP157 [Rhodotorula toruloides]|nr:Nucleoporin NUP157 [Rhodotorula toruloides]
MSLTRSQSTHDAPPTNSLSHSSSNQHASSTSNQVTQQQQGSQQGQGKSEQSEDPVLGPLEKAGKVLEERLARDERWVGVGDSLIGASSSDYVLPPNPAWAPFTKTRTVLLPDRLFEEHDLTQSRCTMGLLPEIERAWVTVDHRLLLWDWADGSSFSTFEELTDVIVGVALVRPRPGVFVDSISHLLVLATPSQVNLVGLGYAAAEPGAKKDVTFYLTGLSVPTDGISFTTIRGTSSGRIFLSSSPDPLTPGGIGGDGCLYELAYQAQEGWFVKRCTLHNLTSGGIAKSVVPSFLRSFTAIPQNDWIVSFEIDNERGLLYTLLRNSTIEMYQLPSSAPGKAFDGPPNKVAKSGDLHRTANMLLPNNPMLKSFRIVEFEVISVKEGGNAKIGLVAVTTTGARLYFTHQRRGYYYGVSGSSAALELCHVRPPPAPSSPQPPAQNGMCGQVVPANQQQQQNGGNSIPFNSIIQAKYASGGLFLAANNLTPDLDVLLVTAPDVSSQSLSSAATATGTVSQQTRPFTEVAGTIEIPGRTWDMAEITRVSSSSATGATALNELATQPTQARREWVVLTNMGANVVSRQRPVDTLVDVLEGMGMNGNAAGQGEIGVFFESYGRDQSCAMLLPIAASNSQLVLNDSATTSSPGSAVNAGARNTSAAVAEQAKALFFEGGGRPVSIDRGGYGGAPQSTASDSKIIFSGRHEGLAFYFARLVRPIWKQKITRVGYSPAQQIANVPESVLSAVQRDLLALRTFVEQEQHLFTPLPDSSRAGHNAAAYAAEQASLSALRLLLTQSVEAISFILLLIDYKLQDIVATCPSDLQQQLAEISYAELLTTKKGRDVARGLVSAVINQQIGRHLSVDAISETLQQRCGSFCSADDVLLYKAIESMRRAKDTYDSTERTECLRESLRLFTKAASHLSLDRLQEICKEYTSMRYAVGVIDLSLACARTWDSSERAITYWLDECPSNDAREGAYKTRQACHKLVFASLEEMDRLLDDASKPNKPAGSMSYEEADSLRTNAYNKALSVKDEFFHFELYDWYLSRGLTNQLLETRTPYLEGFLAREPTTLEKSDLLWQYYVRTSRYARAASVLASLAETPAFPLSLQKRVEYLSLAVGNAKSQIPSSSRGDAVQFLTDVEEKLEVAQVQIEIFRAIEESKMPQDEKQQWLDKVEDRLFTITELYSEFAEPLELLEVILLIFHVSDHRDPFLVTATWEAILARAQEEQPDHPIDAVAAKVTQLGYRFHTSDVSFPLPDLIALLEKFSYERQGDARPGWVPLAIHDAGVPFEAIFAVYDELFIAKARRHSFLSLSHAHLLIRCAAQIPPWHTSAGLTFLASDIVELLSSWLAEASSAPTTVSRAFPATDVESAIGRYLMGLQSASNAGAVVTRLQEMSRAIRRRW